MPPIRSFKNNNMLLFDQALGPLGYKRLKRDVYRATWSTSIEHFIYVTNFGPQASRVAMTCGMRQLSAEKFSLHCLRTFGGHAYSAMRNNLSFDCMMQLPIGRLAGWGMHGSLTIGDFSPDQIVEKVRRDTGAFAIPHIQNIKLEADLYREFTVRIDTWPIHSRNDAALAAQIAYLGFTIGMSKETIVQELEKLSTDIERSLAGEMGLEDYINLLSDREFVLYGTVH